MWLLLLWRGAPGGGPPPAAIAREKGREGRWAEKNTPGQKSAQRSVELSPTAEQLEPPTTTHTDIYCILYTHTQETGISWWLMLCSQDTHSRSELENILALSGSTSASSVCYTLGVAAAASTHSLRYCKHRLNVLLHTRFNT